MQTTGGSFLISCPERTFLPEDFASDEKLMIDSAEQFSRKEVLPLVERLDQQEDGLMPGLVRRAAELGFCGVDSPEEYGGLGLSKNLAARILEFLSLNSSFSVTIGITSGISQVGLSLFGTEKQKGQYLPSLTSGEWMGAYALSEPNSGSDALSASTSAVKRGDKWILNGTKMWISNAKWADLFLVMAKIDGQKFSAFLVERSFPGVSVAREEHKMGLKGSSTARLVLENAEVPLENLLYEEGLGHHVAFNALNLGRFKLSSMSMGPARDAMGLAAGYSQDRRQFGQPIANFGLIRKKFALSAALYFASEAMVYRTGSMIDEAFDAWGGTIEGNRKAAAEYAVECSACKIFATEAEATIVDEMLQCYGGYGFTEEFPIARIYRDARVSRIYEGTNEINRIFLSDRLVKALGESPKFVGDSFLTELAGQALKMAPEGQVALGAASDLVMLAYAEQSARKRSERLGGLATDLYNTFANYANVLGAGAFQTLRREAISIPAPKSADADAIAEAVYKKKGPAI